MTRDIFIHGRGKAIREIGDTDRELRLAWQPVDAKRRDVWKFNSREMEKDARLHRFAAAAVAAVAYERRVRKCGLHVRTT